MTTSSPESVSRRGGSPDPRSASGTGTASAPVRATAPDQPGAVPCPACGTGWLVSDGLLAECHGCGHRAASALVAEASWLTVERSRLQSRLTWLQEQIAAGTVAGPPGRQPECPAGGPSVPGPGLPSPRREDHPAAVQTLLLGGGATLIVIAAVVFAAVAWDRIGPWGQLGLLAVVVGALSGAAHAVRNRFRATAETLAAIGAAVAAVGLIAAPRLGLGPDWMRDRPWAWTAIALLPVAGLGLALRTASGLTAWRVALLVALPSAAVCACFALSPDSRSGPAPLAVAVLSVLGAGLLVRDARAVAVQPPAAQGQATPAHRPSEWTDLGVLGTGAGLLAAALTLTGYGDEPRRIQWCLVWAVVALSAIGVRALATGPGSPPGGANLNSVISGWAGVAAANVPVLAVRAALPSHGFDPTDTQPPSGVAIAAMLGLGLLGSALLLATTLTAVRSTTRLDVMVFAVAAALTLWVLTPTYLTAGENVTAGLGSAYLALIAVTCFAVALGRRSPGWPAWPGAVLGSAACWVLLGDHAVSPLEVYTLSSAGLLLLAGALCWLVGRASTTALGSTTALAGPGLAMALLPSALSAFGEAVTGQGPTRGLLVLAAGAVMVVAGAVIRWQAPFLVGLAGALVAGLGQLWSLADLVPRWVALALAGALLVGAGFGFELIATTRRRFWRFTRAMQ